jgi:signal transduction histidine kinase
MDTPSAASRGLRWAGVLAWAAAALPVALAAVDRGFPARFVVALAAFALFLAAFWWTTAPAAESDRRRLLLGAGLLVAAALGAAFAVPATSTFVLAVVAAALFPFVFSLRVAVALVAAQTVAIAAAYRGAPPAALATLAGVYAGFQLFALFVAWLMESERRARLALAATNAQLRVTHRLLADRVRRAERDRLAGDLHDLLGHELVALRVNLEAARRHEGDVARTHLAQAAGLAERMLADVRDLAVATRRSPTLDVAGALRDLAAGVPRPVVDIAVDPELALDDADVAEAVVRCGQESLTNAMKHGDAAHLRIEVGHEPHRIVVTSRDDGNGAGPVFAFGEGLSGLRRRAERLGGTLEAGNVPGGGFRVRMEVPLREGET